MSRLTRQLLLAFLFLLPCSPVQAEESEKAWRVVLARDVHADYQRFIKGRDPLTLKSFDGPYSRRDVVEVVLLQQALQRGGATRPLRFLLTDSESRTLKVLIGGDADISGASSWKIDIALNAGTLRASHAVIREGEFMAGLYFPEQHPALHTLTKKPQDIRRYTAVCAESWKPDIATLKKLGSPILLTDNWESMLGMLKKQRGDYLLAPFQPTADFRLAAGGIVLKPVPGLKVGLSGSRHFVIARKTKDAATLEQALNRGLHILEKEGVLRRAYRESGFEHADLQQWRTLKP